MKILYVCTDNICRSPLAEAVTRHRAELLRLNVITGSAGTHGYHIGATPDLRSIEVAKRRSISMQGQAARKLSPQDFQDWDLILAMDHGHLTHLQNMSPLNSRAHVELFMFYAIGKMQDVPDPYYGTITHFENVFEMIDQGVNGIYEKLRMM